MQKNRHFFKKKTKNYKERSEEKREQFLKEIEKISVNSRVYVDESGIDQYIDRPFGRSFLGKKVHGIVSGRRYQRESFIAGKAGTKILAPFCYHGTCNADLFNFWLKHFLLPELSPGQVVILDNATFHKSFETKELIESVGCQVLFLPPYSPDLNPIEIFWANLKNRIRETLRKLKNLSLAIDQSFSYYLRTT